MKFCIISSQMHLNQVGEKKGKLVHAVLMFKKMSRTNIDIHLNPGIQSLQGVQGNILVFFSLSLPVCAQTSLESHNRLEGLQASGGNLAITHQ